jgi:uncharacterized glyoxalase superfamily protein PhnB
VARSLRAVFNVAGFDEMVSFYRDVLGFARTGGWDRGKNDRGALIEIVPGAVIEIVGHEPGFATPNYHDAALAIELPGPEEVDEFYERLRNQGFDVGRPMIQVWNHYSFSVRDPVDTEVVLYSGIKPPRRKT